MNLETILLLFTSTSLAAIVVHAICSKQQPRDHPAAAKKYENIGEDSRHEPAGEDRPREYWHPEEKQHRRTERRYWLAQTVVAVFTLLLTGAAFWGVVRNIEIANSALREARIATAEARREANAAEDQVKASKDIAARQLRAYITASPRIDKFLPNEVVSATADIKTTGQSPAYNVRAYVAIGVFPNPKLPSADIIKADIDGYLSNVYTYERSAMSSNDPFPNHISAAFQRIPKDLYEAIVDRGEDYVYVWGHIYYSDINHCNHFIYYCYKYGSASLTDSQILPAQCKEPAPYDATDNDGACETNNNPATSDILLGYSPAPPPKSK